MKKKAPSQPVSLDGSVTVAEIVTENPLKMITMGKTAIIDCAARLRQISGLKPGSSSIRSDAMIDAILSRLMEGETLTSILTDPKMPAATTFWNWCQGDDALDSAVTRAQAIGQRTLADIRMDIAAGGVLSTGDPRRDELLIKTINANIAQRNRKEFGERQQIDIAATSYILPPGADDY